MSRLTSEVQGSQTIRIEHHNLARREAEASSYLLAYGDTSTAKIFVSPGIAYFGGDVVDFAGDSSALISDPAASDRIDIHYLDSAGVLQVLEGTEDDSPTAPTLDPGFIPVAQVYNRPGQTIIDDSDQGGGDGYIDKDTRPFLDKISPSQTEVTGSRSLDTEYENTSKKWLMLVVSVSVKARTNSNGNAQAAALIGAASPAATQIAVVKSGTHGIAGTNDDFVVAQGTMTFFVPPGWFYEIESTIAGGTDEVTLVDWWETELF